MAHRVLEYDLPIGAVVLAVTTAFLSWILVAALGGLM